jgi:hypothetical protein
MSLARLLAALSLLGAIVVLALPVVVTAQSSGSVTPPPPASQNPSPMIEATRAHARLSRRSLGGITHTFPGPAGKPVEVWIGDGVRTHDAFELIIHFHGAAWVPQQAVASLGNRAVAAVLNLGSGSGAYDRAFTDPAAFDSLLATITHEVIVATLRPRAHASHITLVGFSAGHGAVRAILREPRHAALVNAVLLLDGMHTSYVPEGQGLALNGTLDTTNLIAFRDFARAAMHGDKRFLVTHSEIFPGTFASTTETADWMLESLGLHRTPVLRWGPRGMQQLSEVRSGRFALLGFAGNSAPDHIDELHAMPELLKRLVKK